MSEPVLGCKNCGRLLGRGHAMTCPARKTGRVVVNEEDCEEWSPPVPPEPKRMT